ARLFAAGVPMDLAALAARLSPSEARPHIGAVRRGPVMRIAAHLPPVRFTEPGAELGAEIFEVMEPAPALPPVLSAHAADASPVRPRPRGPTFDRRQLETLASGRISSVFGPQFARQDDYARQVRMPEPPLLLADRVLGIDGAPGEMGLGTIWTETDVTLDAW